MAIVTMTTTPNGKGAIIYCIGGLDQKGHNGIGDRNEYVTGYNVIPYVSVISQFEKQWLYGRKNHTVQILRIIQSFSTKELDPDNPEDVQMANTIGRELAEKHYPNCLSLVFTQTDSQGSEEHKGPKVHNHILICDRDIFTHKGCNRDQKNLFKIREWSDEICSTHFTLDHGSKHADKYTSLERILTSKGITTVKQKFRDLIDQAMDECTSEDDFYSKCKEVGLDVEKKYNKRDQDYHFTYTLTKLTDEDKKYIANREKRMSYLKDKPLKYKAQTLAYDDYYDYGGLQKHLYDLTQPDDAMSTHIKHDYQEPEDTIVDTPVEHTYSNDDLELAVKALYEYIIGNTKKKKKSIDKYPADKIYEKLDKEFADNNVNTEDHFGALDLFGYLGEKADSYIGSEELYDFIDDIRDQKHDIDIQSMSTVLPGPNTNDAKRVDHDKKVVDVDSIMMHAAEISRNTLENYESFVLSPATGSIVKIVNATTTQSDDGSERVVRTDTKIFDVDKLVRMGDVLSGIGVEDIGADATDNTKSDKTDNIGSKKTDKTGSKKADKAESDKTEGNTTDKPGNSTPSDPNE